MNNASGGRHAKVCTNNLFTSGFEIKGTESVGRAKDTTQDRQGGGSSGMMKVPLVDWRGRYAVTRSKIRGAIEENLNVIPWKLLPTVSLLLFMPDESFGGGIREFYR